MRTLLAFMLLSLPLMAQTPVQGKSLKGDGHTSYQIVLEPTVKGQSIVVETYLAGAIWQPGPVCIYAQVFCDYNLYDSQGNNFIQVNRDYPNLLYVPASKGGPETITIIYTNATAGQAAYVDVMVFPVTLVLQDVIPPMCNFMPKTGQQPICNPWNPYLSVNATDDAATISSYPIVSSVPNELFIGVGNYPGGQTLTPAPGWSVPLDAGGTFISYYATADPVGTKEIFTLFLSPGLPEGTYAYMGISGFKAIPIEPVIIQ